MTRREYNRLYYLKNRTKEIKRAMNRYRAIHADPDRHAALKEYLRQRNAKISAGRPKKSTKGIPHSAEHNRKVSIALTGYKRGPMPAWHKAKIAAANKGKEAKFPKRRFYYKGIPFRSSWEVAAAQAFDARGIRWEWEAVQFDLGNGKTYRPDFHLIDLECFWEVKGYLGSKSRETIK